MRIDNKLIQYDIEVAKHTIWAIRTIWHKFPTIRYDINWVSIRYKLLVHLCSKYPRFSYQIQYDLHTMLLSSKAYCIIYKLLAFLENNFALFTLSPVRLVQLIVLLLFYVQPDWAISKINKNPHNITYTHTVPAPPSANSAFLGPSHIVGN